ncbi:hypothetical protein B0H17DRAFT_550785 [Mycena rosella]|uniref:F-box domain-containing protein n=1 Tax=Mycena rosella TaxID=1033263 RepID=A0AAD7DJW0_MYCRO|nr:hypothetical protein B0H17DRAFT_550785 [Mycena rosella]
MTSHCPTCGGRSSLVEEESFDWDDIHVAPGTRHYGLLTSNEVPLDTEFLAVQSVIAKTDARLMFLDTEISRLRDRLQQLKDERIAVSNFRLQNNAILSPLRRIPPEVLAEIFAWTLPSADEIVATDRCGFDIGRSPWVLGHISRQWRAVSLSTPCLWSLVVIDYSFSTWYPLPFLEAQIARARNLEIHFYGCQDSDSRPQITFFQTLVERSSIWKELKIGLTSDLVPHLTTLRNRIPLLRSLWIEWDDPESQTAADLIDAFHTAPSLLDASIWNQHRFISIPLPFHQLTQYDFDGSWATHESILKTAPNLVEARITIAFDEQPWPEQDDIIALLYLRRLYVSDSDVLVYLRTPILQEIVFFSREDDPDPLPHLEPFIIRSRCNLARICFRGSPEAQEVIAILEKFECCVRSNQHPHFPPDHPQRHRECSGGTPIIDNRFRMRRRNVH